MREKMHYRKPNLFCYRLAQIASNIVAQFIFKRKVLRNEIKNAKGPYLVIANHQAAYDFVNLIGITKPAYQGFFGQNRRYSQAAIPNHCQ